MKYLIIAMLLCSCSSTFTVNGQRIETKKRITNTEVKAITLYSIMIVIAWNAPFNNPLHK